MKRSISILLALVLFVFAFGFAQAENLGVNDVLAQNEEEAVLTVNPAAGVEVKAKAYALMDVNTGTLLAGSSENEKLYPASVTKIMSLLLVCEAINAGTLSFDETVVCSDTAAQKGGSQIWLEPGEEMTVRELLKAIAVYSANDACCLLGEKIAGSESAFVELMNRRAEELGMTNTHFDNCTGLDDDTTTHLTTAYDIALMARQLMKNEYIQDYTTIWMDSLRNGKTQLVNTNKLIRYYSGATGLKTGTTSKAGCCVCATAERDGLGLIAVVLGAANSNDRFGGARALLDYGFSHYEIYTPVIDIAGNSSVKVCHGEESEVGVYVEGVKDILLNKGVKDEIEQNSQLEAQIDAPVSVGQKLGSVSLFAGTTQIAEYDLRAKNEVKKLTVFSALKRIFRSFSER
ncbi:MAG: D-alanyl-D-alanine carboxypeptidase [Clostridia bacterium]|nr:D-alanyl-D-alanine carboxypeptidase [Clostridia bacterium]